MGSVSCTGNGKWVIWSGNGQWINCSGNGKWVICSGNGILLSITPAVSLLHPHILVIMSSLSHYTKLDKLHHRQQSSFENFLLSTTFPIINKLVPVLFNQYIGSRRYYTEFICNINYMNRIFSCSKLNKYKVNNTRIVYTNLVTIV